MGKRTHFSSWATALLISVGMLSSCSGNGGTSGSGTTAPSITTQPSSLSVVIGQTATFSVSASGTSPLTYQWQRNSTNISEATSSTYTTPATTSADNGAKFDVVVTNSEGSVTSVQATLTVTSAPVAPTIATQPTSQTVVVGQTATFSVLATGTSPLSYQWQKNSANISGATASSYTTLATTSADNGSKFDVVVTNSAGSATSTQATLTVTSSQTSTVSVLTYHNDNARTGQNLNETILTPANVNPSSFGKVGFLSVTGLVDAEPLYVPNLTVNGASHNVVFVATEHDLVYAFDADTFTQLWQVSLVGANETTSDDRGCGQVSPEIGVTSTPVIDPSAGPHGTMWVVAMSKDSSGNYYQRLHALDLTTGGELSGSPVTVQAAYPGTGDNSSNGNVVFDPKQYKERPGLLLLNGVVYTSWSSHCDDAPYTAWVIGYNASTLQQTSVIDLTPNGHLGSVWMSGAGLAADSSGSIYLLMANGTFDTTLDNNGFPNQHDYGNAFVRLTTTNNQLAVADYFTMHNTVSESNGDVDLGSGGALVLPNMTDGNGQTRQLAVGAGKDSIIYLCDRTSMGKFNSSTDNIYQEVTSNGISGGAWSMPAYFNNTLYYGAVGDNLKAFAFSNAKLATPPSSQSSANFGYPGTTPSISANGASNGIVWAVENNNGGVLHAYDATNLATELYNSNQAANGRDNFSDNKYITPMIVNGKVYVGTPTGVIVFGLLN
ncbi:MAG TPA: immunoglobulin domain-containing protein [Candidatus Acidoferrum sp.]|nr:immunoglobulin domain-containing protein [Candidatus Acidoferrum sp.]